MNKNELSSWLAISNLYGIAVQKLLFFLLVASEDALDFHFSHPGCEVGVRLSFNKGTRDTLPESFGGQTNI